MQQKKKVQTEQHPVFDSMVVPRLRAPSSNLLELAPSQPTSTSEVLVEALTRLGVKHAFGVMGGAIAPFCEAVERSSIELMHFRHEAGAAFAATEASLASGRPVVVYTTTGPGLTNALTGLFAARVEGAKVILVSGSTSAMQRGRFAFQETSSYSMAASTFFASGMPFNYTVQLEQAGELEFVISKLGAGISRPGAFVAHVTFPIAVQLAVRESIAPRASSMAPPMGDPATIQTCAEMLSEEPFVIWAGFGARHASREILALAERTGAKVMCSPRAKGIFPETHPLYLGNTGIGGVPETENYVSKNRPSYILVLGSRLGEGTSSWSTALTPSRSFIHVDTNPEVFGAAYPSVETFGVHADVKGFVAELIEQLPSTPSGNVSAPKATRLVPRTTGPVRPQMLMQSIQDRLVDKSDALVMSEAGNSAVWANHILRFESPKYRVSTSFGSMGQSVTGVVGAAMGAGKKAIAIVGDGAMLMFNEVSTAVQYEADVVWIVLNDAQYGMIEQGMKLLGWKPFATAIPRVDFVAFARSMGADGMRVDHEDELDTALDAALARRGPFVVDVDIDSSEVTPSIERSRSLMSQQRGA